MEMFAPADYRIPHSKVVFIGSSSSGKTSLINRIVTDAFETDSRPTLGAGLTIYNYESRVRLNIWDTAGQENYRSLAKVYYRDAQIAVVVFDVTRKESFNEVEFWFGEISQTVGEHRAFLVGNKIDRNSERVVSKSEAEVVARRNMANYIESSALNGEGIKTLIDSIAEAAINLLEDPSAHRKHPDITRINPNDNSHDGCCK
ncbi:Ras-related protein Rab-6.1 [Tritrichomonas foetus]|uniref:Ras-related protein Rab-6.1 n=1 Tax=Tritrichomonas foetus TaxID=1144522 RepID=A0A1J4JBE5_9EUKA|nr:Ras-related protein Rab-6.1 [Tritrichomonas foetus]|eukprot:OHS95993.1 Ras-related protein Rab-6.1 [Tritrichomonas foetus]